MAKFTVIHTKQQTTLTITTPPGKPLGLDVMTGDGTPKVVRTLRPGATETVSVDPGLYLIVSDSVRVTAVSESLSIVTVNSKDDPPEHLTKAFGKAAVSTFLEAKGESLSAPSP
jgi:hypothetical protein